MRYFKPKLERGWVAGNVGDEHIIMTLASLFIERPSEWSAFSQLVPKVVEAHSNLRDS